MYGPTEVKIAEVRELLAQKRRGSHRGKPWSWAIAKASWTQEHGPLDLKTAQKHLATERAEWDSLNAKEQGRASPGSKPKE